MSKPFFFLNHNLILQISIKGVEILDNTRTVKRNSDLNIRTEFSFIVSDLVLASILSDIAQANVNIAGFFTNRTKTNKNFVRLVPGSAEVENKRDLRVVRKTLQAHKIHYKEQKIITISPNRIPSGVPGGYSNIYSSLWCRVKVKSFYVGEKDFVYLNVSNIKKALEILSKENVRPCNSKLR